MVNISPKQVLDIARKYFNVTEMPPSSNNVIFNTEYYGKAVQGKAYPWCAVFLWYIFKEAGASALFYGGQKCAYTPTLANYYKQQKRFYATPKVGDIVFYQFSGSNRINHVGIVTEVLGPNKIKTIEGNTSIGNDSNGGAVLERTRSTTYVKGFGRPLYNTEVENPATKVYTQKDFIKDVQKVLKVKVDGIAGKITLGATITVSKTSNNRHAVVVPLQKYLKALGYYKGNIDGYYYTLSEEAVKKFQSSYMRKPDGIIDAKETTWKKLLGIK